MLYSGSTFRILDTANNLPVGSSEKAPQENYIKRGIILGSRRNQPHANPGQKLFVTVPQDYPEDVLTSGIHPGFCIGRTRNGFPRIEHGQDDEYVYLVLSSKLSPVEDGIGTIRIPKNSGFYCIASVQATSKRCPNSRWRAVIMRAVPGDAYLVSWTPNHNKITTSMLYYVASRDCVLACRRENLHRVLWKHGVNPATLPFEAWYSCCESKIKRSEWRTI